MSDLEKVYSSHSSDLRSLDLQFWYVYGPGNPAVAAQGVGWLQELVSRLTQTRITTFATSVNETIVSSNV